MRAIAIAVVLLFLGPTAAAQEAPGADQEARALFEDGRRAFEDGAFELALDSFRRAYDLSGRPELLYNVAMSYDRLRDDRSAVEWFERYLREAPEAPNRPSVERRLSILRRNLDAGGSDGGLSPWPFVVLGTSAALAASAVAFWVVANDADADLEAACTAGCSPAQIDDSGGPTYVTLTNVFLISAIAAGVAGATFLIIDLASGSGGEADVSVSIAPLPSVAGRF